jgi:UDP-hydrolysing UDP-N-acetyl-D-glucosamine 2-epimerase
LSLRKIAVATATRAEYGLLKNLLNHIQADAELHLQLLVTGAHLSANFGNSIEEIIGDGFPIAAQIDMQLANDSPQHISKSMALALTGFADTFAELKPDLLVVLGDRYELIPIVTAANIANIPIAHLHGGELTEGSKDEVFRHAITKLSHLHFTSLEEYANRIIHMGEAPNRVFNTGAIGLDNIFASAALEKHQLETYLGIKFQEKNLLITYHPDTQENIDHSLLTCQKLLQVLAQQQNTLLIFTKANADLGGNHINELINQFVVQHPDNAVMFDSLGRLRYLSCLKYINGLIGNSSSGIYEAAAFKLGVINIGDRQKGRVRGGNVIDTLEDETSLLNAFEKLYSPTFKASLENIVNPYGQGKASEKIVQTLKTYNLDSLRRKVFYDGTDEPII